MQKICKNCLYYDETQNKCTESNLYIIAILSCANYKKSTNFKKKQFKILTKKKKQLKCYTIMRKSS